MLGENRANQPRSKKRKDYQDDNVIQILSDDEHGGHVGAPNDAGSNGDAPSLEPPVPVVNEMVPEPVAPMYLNFDWFHVSRNHNEYEFMWI